jgi:hypothetical protein
MSKFYALARIRLEDNPKLLEAIGKAVSLPYLQSMPIVLKQAPTSQRSAKGLPTNADAYRESS